MGDIELFDSLPQFISRREDSSCHYHLSLQNDFKPAKNTQNNIGIWTAGGRKDLTIAQYLKLVKSSKCSSFDCYSDSDTLKGSNKRLQKSVEYTIKYTKECLELCRAEYPELIDKMYGVIPGGSNTRRRQQAVTELFKLHKFSTVVLENVELGNAVDVYKACIEALPEGVKIVVSFAKSEKVMDNVKFLACMDECYKLRACRFQTNAFFVLADHFYGMKTSGDEV